MFPSDRIYRTRISFVHYRFDKNTNVMVWPVRLPGQDDRGGGGVGGTPAAASEVNGSVGAAGRVMRGMLQLFVFQ